MGVEPMTKAALDVVIFTRKNDFNVLLCLRQHFFIEIELSSTVVRVCTELGDERGVLIVGVAFHAVSDGVVATHLAVMEAPYQVVPAEPKKVRAAGCAPARVRTLDANDECLREVIEDLGCGHPGVESMGLLYQSPDHDGVYYGPRRIRMPMRLHAGALLQCVASVEVLGDVAADVMLH